MRDDDTGEERRVAAAGPRRMWSAKQLDEALADVAAATPMDSAPLERVRARLVDAGAVRSLATSDDSGSGTAPGRGGLATVRRPRPFGAAALPWAGRFRPRRLAVVTAALIVAGTMAGSTLLVRVAGTSVDRPVPAATESNGADDWASPAVTPSPRPTMTRPDPTTPDGVLLKAAKQAASPALAKPRGRYRYQLIEFSEVRSGNGFTVRTRSGTELWISADLTEPRLTRWRLLGEREWLRGSQADAVSEVAGWPGEPVSGSSSRFAYCGPDGLARGKQHAGVVCEPSGSWATPTLEFLKKMPREPRRLYDRLLGDADQTGSGSRQPLTPPTWSGPMPLGPRSTVLNRAEILLGSGLASGELRMVLYLALIDVPGLVVTDPVVEVAGRSGVALGVLEANRRYEIIIDPASGDYLGGRETLVADEAHLQHGSLIASRTVRIGVADALGTDPTRVPPDSGT